VLSDGTRPLVLYQVEDPAYPRIGLVKTTDPHTVGMQPVP
jgi:hypothetical protein